MHLTNYAIQKKSEAFVANEDEDDDSAHKRSLSSVLEQLENDEPGFKAKDMMLKIEDIIVKTIISAQPSLAHAFRACQPDDQENSMCF